MDTTKLLINEKAKKKIKYLLNRIIEADECSYMDILTIKDWINLKGVNVKCYVLSQDDVEKSFVILRECEFDHLKNMTNEHTKPKLISFVYTFSDYRQNGFAYKLLSHVKQYDETTAFCSSNGSRKLFEKAGFKMIDCNMLLAAHRFP